MFKRMHNERGFTLVELLVVLAILAILVAIVVPNLAGLVPGARTTAQHQERDVVQSAIDTYNTQNVGVHAEPTIAAQVSWTQLDPTKPGVTFAISYLRRITKYCYTWEDNGDKLAVTVCPP